MIRHVAIAPILELLSTNGRFFHLADGQRTWPTGRSEPVRSGSAVFLIESQPSPLRGLDVLDGIFALYGGDGLKQRLVGLVESRILELELGVGAVAL